MKNLVVVKVQSAVHLEAFLIKQRVLFLHVSNALGMCRGMCLQSHASYAEACSFILMLKVSIFMKILLMILKKRFDISNYEVNRPLPTGNNKKVIGLIKDELGGKIMTEFKALTSKTFLLNG